MKYLLIFLFFIFMILGVFAYWNYLYIYSHGYREGVLNKFSTKGTIFKTNEGELLMPGVVPTFNQLSNNFFYFSSVDPGITKELNDAIGKKIKVHYVQYNASLPWRGDNYEERNKEKGQYIVDDIEVVQ